MSWAAGRPPVLRAQDVALIAARYFNFNVVHEDSLKPLPSYCDRNYYFQGEHRNDGGREFILKLANPLSTSYDVIRGIVRLMKHLNSKGLLVPCPLSGQTEEDAIQLSSTEMNKGDRECEPSSAEGTDDEQGGTMKYPVFVLSFIPGQIFDHVNKKYLTPALLYEIGELLGRINKELVVHHCVSEVWLPQLHEVTHTFPCSNCEQLNYEWTSSYAT